MSLVPEDVQMCMQKFQETVEALQRNAETLTTMLSLPQRALPKPAFPSQTPAAQSDKEEEERSLSHLERARGMHALGQVMHTLQQLHMKACGLDPQKHFVTDIHKECERLEAYKKKVAKAVAAHELATSKPTVSLNVSAANRFIDHAIPDLNPEQRRLLKEQSAAGKRKAEQQVAGRGSKKGRGASSSASGADKGVGKKAAQGRSVKDHAISFLSTVLQEGISSAPLQQQDQQPLPQQQ
uniref:Nuclear nucleic acid-binding protein C1D n=1 Tax=Dunaliella tertiolecta TaxID=3047 RepID=A0A7S3QJX9_DUNTE|mmetsp:Transcript_3294/g.7565  ORF Transcript_3294/g.7565 Transcript_3294/m.7565 type:complete len:239 (+) Transcript_3294:67-783(+)|eukprot:CAMPEP_0202382218 /NCGR_PEP_ID=MMETSP1127-20130417/41796_1 /ASSEMBLY_ACC=CAM_ASM_000462 /TAXON_ID=3047 /ORGANISM="Dunaliella tertiolecta, Strain CCMP1320" /LENGTH=238 /DNA_ID=CAMNT_0048981365 /DNA_START=57 /DNA_END=776 /DNA_ORIENTATION=-